MKTTSKDTGTLNCMCGNRFERVENFKVILPIPDCECGKPKQLTFEEDKKEEDGKG